jgi:RNA polymerase sigma-70 factor (ECF subfamily)
MSRFQSMTRLDPESSVELLVRVRDGDPDALDVLLRRHLPPLKRWASGRLPRWARDLSETQDLVQDSILRSLKHLGTFQPNGQGGLRAYFRQAVMNRISDEVRRARRRPASVELGDAVPSEGASPLEVAVGREIQARYEAALAELKPKERQAIVARIELEQSYREIAAALGKRSPDAARVAVRRALERLEAKMKRVP